MAAKAQEKAHPMKIKEIVRTPFPTNAAANNYAVEKGFTVYTVLYLELLDCWILVR